MANNKNRKTLIVIDYQNDFIDLNGALNIGSVGPTIEDNIYNLVNNYLEDSQLVVFTMDFHKKDLWQAHPESKSFPMHCLEGTEGANLYGKLSKFTDDDRVLLIKKNSFLMPTEQLEKIVDFSDEITLVGVVTDICVLQQAIALYNISNNRQKYIDFYIKENCCASFDPDAHKYALNYMKNTLGFKEL